MKRSSQNLVCCSCKSDTRGLKRRILTVCNGYGGKSAFLDGNVAPSYHLILFREAVKEDEYTFNLLDDMNDKTAEIIYKNADADIKINGDKITVKYSKQRSFIWVKIK